MPEFSTDHQPEYGVAEQVSPLIKRVTANNPGKFTFKGTGTYIVGTNPVAVIDPGPKDDSHIDALCSELEGVVVSHILVTHTHTDHSPAALVLKKNTGGVLCGFGPHPQYESQEAIIKDTKTKNTKTKSDAEEDEEESGDISFIPERFLANGEIIVGNGWTMESIYTPGHISNHLCYAFNEEKAIFTGDHIMGWSTTIIPPPNGNLEDYFDSLRLLTQRSEETYWPTHGGPIKNPKRFVEDLIAHREQRNSEIIGCLQGTDKDKMSIPEIVSHIYKDYPEELHKPAARTILAHMIYLYNKRQITCSEPPKADSEFWL